MANETAAPPRLQRYYEQQVRSKLQEQFGFKTPMQVPKLEKIVINVGSARRRRTPSCSTP
jgi:large subunit ribosomal protein L5